MHVFLPWILIKVDRLQSGSTTQVQARVERGALSVCCQRLERVAEPGADVT